MLGHELASRRSERVEFRVIQFQAAPISIFALPLHLIWTYMDCFLNQVLQTNKQKTTQERYSFGAASRTVFSTSLVRTGLLGLVTFDSASS